MPTIAALPSSVGPSLLVAIEFQTLARIAQLSPRRASACIGSHVVRSPLEPLDCSSWSGLARQLSRVLSASRAGDRHDAPPLLAVSSWRSGVTVVSGSRRRSGAIGFSRRSPVGQPASRRAVAGRDINSRTYCSARRNPDRAVRRLALPLWGDRRPSPATGRSSVAGKPLAEAVVGPVARCRVFWRSGRCCSASVLCWPFYGRSYSPAVVRLLVSPPDMAGSRHPRSQRRLPEDAERQRWTLPIAPCPTGWPCCTTGVLNGEPPRSGRTTEGAFTPPSSRTPRCPTPISRRSRPRSTECRHRERHRDTADLGGV